MVSDSQVLAEGVVGTVNDQIISSYDVIQRMRLLIVTAGIQPTQDNLPEIQREALSSLVDEDLELQELQKESKNQKFDLIASDQQVNDELADIARSNNTSADQLLAQLAAQGVGADTLRNQLKAEISWREWIRGRYGTRLAVGEDQVKAYQQRLEAEEAKPQYAVSGNPDRRRQSRQGRTPPSRGRTNLSASSRKAPPSRPWRANSRPPRPPPTVAMWAGSRPDKCRRRWTGRWKSCGRASYRRPFRSRTGCISSISGSAGRPSPKYSSI